MKQISTIGVKFPASHWAMRGERLFKEAVADAIRRHHEAGRDVYYGEDGYILQWRPDGQIRRLGKAGKSTRSAR